MSRAARVMLLGMMLALAGVGLHAGLDWADLLARYPHYVRPLKRATGQLLAGAGYWAFVVPAALVVIATFRAARATAGRAAIVWRLFAFVTLWAIGSLAFFFGLFLAYAPSMGEGGVALLVPGVLGCLGYLVIGVGFILSLARD